MPGGRGRGRDGSGRGRGGGGRGATGGGRGGNRAGAFGAGGYCICASCGIRVPHERDVKCTDLKCPSCNRAMIREELLNQARNTGEQS